MIIPRRFETGRQLIDQYQYSNLNLTDFINIQFTKANNLYDNGDFASAKKATEGITYFGISSLFPFTYAIDEYTPVQAINWW